ncbi:GTPase Era [Blattella germanica]|nr:GTPase Era [Blattella germanica]
MIMMNSGINNPSYGLEIVVLNLEFSRLWCSVIPFCEVLNSHFSSQSHNLEYEFHSDSEMALLEADVIGVIHDVSNKWTRHRLDPKVVRLLHLYPRKHSFLILNKIDSMKSKRNLLDLVRILTNGTLAKEISPVQPDTEICYTDSMKGKSKRKNQETESNVARDIEINENDSELLDYLLYISQPSPWLYPPSQFTDQPSETIVLDTVRSKLLDNLPNEIPYNLTTTIEYFDFGREEKLLVGSRGRRIGAIAQAAEQELQNTFRQPVRLKVVVTSTDRAVSNNPSAR